MRIYPYTIASEIAEERHRQVEAKGFTPERDDENDPGDLAGAGSAYALNAACLLNPHNGTPNVELPDSWPEHFSPFMWKPATSIEGARRDLIKAAALIVAEIERIDRETGRG